LARLEHIIEQALPQYFNSASQSSYESADRRARSTSYGPDEDNRSMIDEQDPSGGTFQSGKWYGNSASGSVAPASVLEQVNVSMVVLILLSDTLFTSWQTSSLPVQIKNNGITLIPLLISMLDLPASTEPVTAIINQP
jgi:hypothetical protein